MTEGAPHQFERAERGESLWLAIASVLGIGCAFTFLLGCALHLWLFDSAGRPSALMDFIAYWSAGHVALHVSPIAAYNPQILHAAEVAVFGHDFDHFPGLPWSYPPVFLFVAVLLASLPFSFAYIAWNGSMLLLHGSVLAAITRRKAMFFAVWALPWTMMAIMPGQNGILTASLVGLVLLTLENRPALSGLILGLLTYKPQFGLLFPVVLAFGGYWRAFAWACVGTLAWTSLSGAVFGFACLMAFFHGLFGWTNDWLNSDGIGWFKLQSIYGVARWAGASAHTSWLLQSCATSMCAIGLAWLWRGRAPFPLKGAALAAAIPLATPYAAFYDFPLLSIAFGYLLRDGGPDRLEWAALATTIAGFLALVWHPFPLGPFVCAALIALISRRLWRLGAAIRRERPTLARA